MRINFFLYLGALGCVLLAQPANAQSTAFTYQGRLADNGSAANGHYDLRFAIHDAVTNGNLVAGPLTNNAAAVTNGIFTVALDFGAVFNGTDYWLEIGVRTNGGAGAFTTLSPRQPLTPAPHALYAGKAGSVAGVLAATNLPANVATLDGSPVFTSTITAQSFLINTTNDGQNGVYVMQMAGSNAPSTFNFTMASTPIVGQALPDNVFYWGWNVSPGGGNDVSGLPCLYYGIEREWYGQYETYMHFRNGDGSVSYRPFFYGIDRTNGFAQKIEKVDTWQVMVGPDHLTEVLKLNETNNLLVRVPLVISAGDSNALTIQDNVGATRMTVSNGVAGFFNNYLVPDGAGGIIVSQDYSKTNTAAANTWTFGGVKVAGTANTNYLNQYGINMASDSLHLNVNSDLSGLQVNDSDGAHTTILSLGGAGVYDRTVLYCVGTVNNSPVGGLAQYDTVLKSKKGIYFTANDSANVDLWISNRNVVVNGTLLATNVTAATLRATNGLVLPSKSSGPTFAQIGMTNTLFLWSSNSTPPTLYSSYFDGDSNRVDVVK